MKHLLDTNILTRSAQPAHSMHGEAVTSTTALRTAGHELCIAPQNLIEFWAVATRPLKVNGLEMSPALAHAEIKRLKNFFRYLPDTPAIYDEWERLVSTHAVLGKNTYDARIAATMIVHGVTRLVTFNGGDFKRYTEITAISPSEIVKNI